MTERPKNVLFLLIDSLNRWLLNCYGFKGPDTPNLDRFAARAHRFRNHFVGSLPCMPARREIFAGRQDFLWRPWGPLEPWDDNIAAAIGAAGYQTMLVTDHYHYWETAGNGYIQGFQATNLIRGAELDNWRPPIPPEQPVPPWVESIERWRPGWGRRYYANVMDFQDERDFFPAKVMRATASALERTSASTPFYLHVECFDPHEPFHAPEPYRSMYWEGSDGDDYTVWPPYQDQARLAAFMSTASSRERAYVVAQYWAKLAMVDRWLGDVLAVLDARALWDSTVVILTTDHGHDLGSRGTYGKLFPHWDSHAHIPMLCWHPDFPQPREIEALTTTVDLHATLAELTGALTSGPHGTSVLPLLREPQPCSREGLLYGTFGQGICCTDGTWTLMIAPDGTQPLFMYSSSIFDSLLARRIGPPADSGPFVPGVETPVLRIPVDVASTGGLDALYNRDIDPHQSENLAANATADRQRMHDLLRSLLVTQQPPNEVLDRLNLNASPTRA